MASDRQEDLHRAPGMTRRRAGQWLGGALAVLVLGGEYVAFQRHRALVNAQLLRARRARQAGDDYNLHTAAGAIGEALQLDRGRADLWGLAAVIYLQQARLLPPARREALEQQAYAAIDQALELDAGDPDALTADAARKFARFDFLRYEGALRKVLSQAPDCACALEDLGAFLLGTGQWDEAARINRRLLASASLSAPAHERAALLAWQQGHLQEAQRALRQGLAQWPNNPLLLLASLRLCSFGGQVLEARAMLGQGNVSRLLPAPALTAWQAGLEALDKPGQAGAAAALLRQAAAGDRHLQAGDAVMWLAMLERLDDAMAVAGEALSTGGELLPDGSRSTASAAIYADPTWRRAGGWLFAPPSGALRQDSRFAGLCQQAGLTAYWQASGHWPDPALRGSLVPSARSARSG